MKGVAFWFVFSAAVYACLGMAWGIHMAVSEDFTLASMHAHLNLVGWVTMALFGLYYHAVPRAAGATLARVHFVLATLGVWLMVPGIAASILWQSEGLVAVGSILTIASMLVFLFTVIRNRGA